MKKLFICGLAGIFSLSLTGCHKVVTYSVETTLSSVLEHMQDEMSGDILTTKKSMIKIFEGDTEEVLYELTDNAYIMTTYLELLLPKMIGHKKTLHLPSNVSPLYTYELWQEDLDSSLPLDEKPLLKVWTHILYQKDNRFFLLIQLFDFDLPIDTYCIPVSDDTADYLINLADGKKDTPSNLDTKSSIGTPAEYYLESLLDIDYKGISSVSKKQALEGVNALDNEVIFRLTNHRDIYEFIKSQNVENWIPVDDLPDTANKVRIFIRYAQERRTTKKDLKEQYRDILYNNENSYYMKSGGFYFQIPTETGENLMNFEQ